MTSYRDVIDDEHRVTIAPVQSVRHAIARRILGQEHMELCIGSTTLYPHQVSAVCRIRYVLQHHSGAMLFDTVGLGKTSPLGHGCFERSDALGERSERTSYDGDGGIRKRLGRAIRRVGARVGLSQEALAQKAKLHRTPMSEIERGISNVSIDAAERVARAL